ncbi:MAG TPA: hypothetical protein VLX91_01370 [Candidatus Acidoferrales bacterium]|nr:hypothetical protein [Candidatus Acidoferrales bacterium]
MAGNKQKQVGEQSLAHAHEAGSTFVLTQTAIDPVYGAVMFPVIDHTDFYFKAAKHHLAEAEKLREEILSKPLDKSNCRLVFDNQLIEDFFLHSQCVVLFSYLALEYFAIECSRGLGKAQEWKKRRLDQKIKYLIPQELGIPKLSQELCNAFGEIEARRHLLNHPEFKNIVNGSDTDWDSVHVSWMIIGNYKKACNNAVKIYDYLSKPYKSEIVKRSSKQVTLNVQRGMRFDNQVKKKFEKPNSTK